jgi:hypothetical protein
MDYRPVTAVANQKNGVAPGVGLIIMPTARR